MKFELKQQCNFNVTKSFPDTTNPVFVQVGKENSFDQVYNVQAHLLLSIQ